MVLLEGGVSDSCQRRQGEASFRNRIHLSVGVARRRKGGGGREEKRGGHSYVGRGRRVEPSFVVLLGVASPWRGGRRGEGKALSHLHQQRKGHYLRLLAVP